MNLVNSIKIIFLITCFLHTGCNKQVKVEKNLRIDKGAIYANDPKNHFYAIDRATSIVGHKKPIVPMYETKLLVAAWRPAKRIDDGKGNDVIGFDGTWVKFFIKNDRILDYEESNELTINRDEERIIYGETVGGRDKELLKLEKSTRQRVSIPYKRVKGNK